MHLSSILEITLCLTAARVSSALPEKHLHYISKRISSPNTTTSSTSGIVISVNGTCGPVYGNQTCPGDKCCSSSGFCGSGRDFCKDPDCQYKYGTCDSTTTPSGPPTLNDPRPKLGNISYSDNIYHCTTPNTIALTYDDGPSPYTASLLDTLRHFNFTATFFIAGNNNGKGAIDVTDPYPSLIRRMVAEGHQVASHAWSHYNLSDITSDMRNQQMARNERAIANIIGKYPTYMRPPYSSCTAESGCEADLQNLGYHRIAFDLDTQDYLNPNASEIQKSKDIVSANLSSTSVTSYLAIQHDILPQSVANLTDYFYTAIRAKGWKGVAVGECLGDPRENWYRTPGVGR